MNNVHTHINKSIFGPEIAEPEGEVLLNTERVFSSTFISEFRIIALLAGNGEGSLQITNDAFDDELAGLLPPTA